ncbi:MAG: putative rRNA maturation factor [Crocinitomix sp.]|jgi:probable rRNA maturation factor
MVQKLVLPLYPKMDNEILYNFIDIEIPDFNPEFFSLWINHIVVDNEFELGELSYVFCTDDYLLEMNKEHLNHDYYTDIITFNYNVYFSLSGDLFISYDRIIDNAKVLGVSVFDELSRVMIHGVLHLLGYNDKSDKEQEEMTRLENECLVKRNSFT